MNKIEDNFSELVKSEYECLRRIIKSERECLRRIAKTEREYLREIVQSKSQYVSKTISRECQYLQQMKRVKVLPQEYQYVFKKIRDYLWKFGSIFDDDMMELQYGLIDLFEKGAAEGKSVLEITGEDVAFFTEELLKNVTTYQKMWRTKLNQQIKNNIEKRKK